MTKTIVDQIQDKFKEFTNQIFTNFGEPTTLMLVVNWSMGSNDFPAGFLITREDIKKDFK